MLFILIRLSREENFYFVAHGMRDDVAGGFQDKKKIEHGAMSEKTAQDYGQVHGNDPKIRREHDRTDVFVLPAPLLPGDEGIKTVGEENREIDVEVKRHGVGRCGRTEDPARQEDRVNKMKKSEMK